MARLFRRVRREPALPPGTVEFFGEKKTERVRVRLIDYDADHLEERDLETVEAFRPLRDTGTVSWIHVTGLHDTQLLKSMGEVFGLHPLVLEDIVNTHQRPKLEDYGNYLYIALRMLDYQPDAREVSSEQVSIILGPHYVLSFDEEEGDVFEPVRERLRSGKGRSRSLGPDYLAYALLDAVVDHAFIVLERLGEEIETLEEDLIADPRPATLQSVHRMKREMILLRKSVWPLREVAAGLERGDSELVRKDTTVYLRDVYDHTVQLIDAVESFRDILSGMQDLYLSSISNRLNEVMKVLTIISTIFIPVSFVAGVYGMNFRFMPEIGWKWSYPLFWGVIVSAVGGMLVAFRKRGWL